jgi:pimeloyl-ACP methyl ester carboxylesterase
VNRQQNKRNNEQQQNKMAKTTNCSSDTDGPPLRILYHSLPKLKQQQGHGNDNGPGDARLHVYGNPNSKHLVIMSGGFPDTQQAFTPMAKRLATTAAAGGCLVGITLPPGYDDSLDLSVYPKDGYSFDDWVTTMECAIVALRSYSKQPTEETTLTGIFHDWGVLMGTMYANHISTKMNEKSTNKNYKHLKLDRLVIYDILMPAHPETENRPRGNQNKTLRQKASQISYQLFLASAFVIYRYLSIYATMVHFAIGNAFAMLLGIYPVSQGDMEFCAEFFKIQTIAQLRRLTYMTYPYAEFWKIVLQGKLKSFLRQICLPKNVDETPILYLYGSGKPYDLSDANAVALLEREQLAGKPSRVIKVDGAGHWLYRQQPDVCHAAMQDFFDETIDLKKCK